MPEYKSEVYNSQMKVEGRNHNTYMTVWAFKKNRGVAYMVLQSIFHTFENHVPRNCIFDKMHSWGQKMSIEYKSVVVT